MMGYDLLKALHVLAVVTWMGGMLAVALFLSLPVARVPLSADWPRVAKSMRAWDRAVTTPAMLIVWALGLTMALQAGWFAFHWLPIKLVFVVLISGLHGIQSGALRRVAGGANAPSMFAARAVPPALLAMVGVIVILVVLKPF